MMIIVGAGLSGLIAASMLRDEVDAIYEAQPELPNNHSALLRFRSSVVGDATGIPFRKVKVMKASQPWRNPVADAMAYSRKVTGSYTLRSSTTARGEIEERFIAPDDFIQRLFDQVGHKIEFSSSLGDALYENQKSGKPKSIVSTIPMKSMIKTFEHAGIKGWPSINFPKKSAQTLNYEFPEGFDVCATVYISDPENSIYRASITERRLIIEATDDLVRESDLADALEALGILSKCSLGLCDPIFDKLKIEGMKKMPYAKILPIPEADRRAIIMRATELGVYSLGRFATWRPNLLLDDVVNDVRVIQRMIHGDNSSQYNARKS